MNGDRLKLHKEKLILTALWAYALSRFSKKREIIERVLIFVILTVVVVKMPLGSSRMVPNENTQHHSTRLGN